jgi:hypothetical protein
MADRDGEAVGEHVRQMLARISALKRRLRAQESAGPPGSREKTVESDREDHEARSVDGPQRPA